MKRFWVWMGTRPEAIKLCPLILELRRRGARVRIMLTGQHRDMVSPVLSFFGISADEDLSVMRDSQSVQHLTERLLIAMGEVLARTPRPDAVLVHGDTSTALCGAMSAFYAGIPIYHVEAGLRSDDIHAPFPEEFNRRAIDAMSDIHFAPTDAAARRLRQEGYSERGIFVVGNTATDALRLCLEQPLSHPLLEETKERLILLTSHRREWGEGERVELLRGIRDAIEHRTGVRVIFPVHPSPVVQRAAWQAFGGCENVIMTDPLPLPLMQHLLARAWLLLTDSGGLQEEASYLGVPTLVLRTTTERPEGVAAGVLRVVGGGRETVRQALELFLRCPAEREAMAHPSMVFGDGHAARYITDVLMREDEA